MTPQLLTEIREANLAYLMLAKALIREDRAQALYRLGIGDDTASMIEMLSTSQMVKVASSNTVLCRMRFDDSTVWGLLTDHGRSGDHDSVPRLHASILIAGRHCETV